MKTKTKSKQKGTNMCLLEKFILKWYVIIIYIHESNKHIHSKIVTSSLGIMELYDHTYQSNDYFKWVPNTKKLLKSTYLRRLIHRFCPIESTNPSSACARDTELNGSNSMGATPFDYSHIKICRRCWPTCAVLMSALLHLYKLQWFHELFPVDYPGLVEFCK